MKDKIKKAFIHLLSSIQTGKLYSTSHPKFNEFLEKTYLILKDILREKGELVIGIIEGELAWGEEIFFNLSQRLRSLILYLMDREIEKISFLSPLTEKELRMFITLLLAPKGEMPPDIQKHLVLQGVNNIKVGKLKGSESLWDKEIEDSEALKKQYKSSVDIISDSITTAAKEEEMDFLDLRFNMFNIMENFSGRHQELLTLATAKEKDLLTYVHLLNVAILSMYISSKLGFCKDDVLDIGIASLFHDIGKIAVSLHIIQKESKLNQDEFDEMKSHTILGAKILSKYIDSLGILPLVVAFEHHLRFDLTGYPKVSYSQKPHIASYITSLCDVYDALAQKRSYKQDFPPSLIYETMMKEKGKLFDPDLLERFFQIMGVWPVGSIVRLDDNRVAVVREASETNIYKPKVEILSPEGRGEIIYLDRDVNGLKIRRALNPFAEGKEYLHMI